jgi:nitrogen regulatory protein PII
MNTRDGRLITIILPAGTGHGLLEKLVSEKGLTTVFLHHARGTGLSGALKRKGLAQQIEKDMLVAAVPTDTLDDIIGFIYEEGGGGKPHGGFIYIEKLTALRGGVPAQLNAHSPLTGDGGG